MTSKERQDIENIVEQKLLEFLGDPDEGLRLRPAFASELKKRLKKKQKLIPMATVAKKYGLR